MQAAQDRQKNYADQKRKPVEFKIRDRVMLKDVIIYYKVLSFKDKALLTGDEIEIDENLHFVEEPIEIVERDVKRLKRRRIPLVKVRWNSRQGAEYTWELEDQFRKKYPHLFTEPVPSSSAAT
nr:hypothetical protein [Tanacetum cinerariifolium]